MAGGLLLAGSAVAAGSDASSGSAASSDPSTGSASSGDAQGQPSSTSKPVLLGEKSAHKGVRKWIAGTVASVGSDRITVAAQDGQPRDLAVDSETNFLADGKPIGQDQVKEGDDVRASYVTRADGTYHANAIIVFRGADQGSATGSAATSGSGSQATSGTGSFGSSGSSGSSTSP